MKRCSGCGRYWDDGRWTSPSPAHGADCPGVWLDVSEANRGWRGCKRCGKAWCDPEGKHASPYEALRARDGDMCTSCSDIVAGKGSAVVDFGDRSAEVEALRTALERSTEQVRRLMAQRDEAADEARGLREEKAELARTLSARADRLMTRQDVVVGGLRAQLHDQAGDLKRLAEDRDFWERELEVCDPKRHARLVKARNR